MLSWPASVCSLGPLDTTAGGEAASAMPENFSVCSGRRGGRQGPGGHHLVAATGRASLHLSDEPSPGLVALAVRGPFLLLLQDTLPAGAVLQGELLQQLADGRHLHVPRCTRRVPQVEQKGVKPAETSVTAGHQGDRGVAAVSPGP